MPNIYIDASGNPGSVSQTRENPILVYATVHMADEISDTILKRIHVECASLLPTGRIEFKSSSPCKASKLFIDRVLDEVDFGWLALIGRKDEFENYGWRFPEPCDKWFLRTSLEQIKTSLRTGCVFIDWGSNPESDKEVAKYLNKYFNTEIHLAVKNMRLVDSKDFAGVQLADILAGSLRRFKHKPNKRNTRLWEKTKMKLTNLVTYPFEE